MGFRFLNLVSALLIVGSSELGMGQASGTAANTGEQVMVPGTTEQLEINRDALLRGSTDQIRVKAATLILLDTSPQAREILMEVLNTGENVGAVAAVCKALGQARAQEKPVLSPEQFLTPVMGLLTRPNTQLGSVAAEACQFFNFDTIGPALMAVVADAQQPVVARLNVMMVLQQQPDKRAVIALLNLVDDPDAQVAALARTILHAQGIPEGKDSVDRRAIMTELRRKSKDEFLRDYVLGQEKRIQKERQDAETWRQLYLENLARLYGTLADDTQRGAFLTEHLKAPQAERRRWALAKAYEWRMAAGSNLPETMSPVFLELIADGDRAVRLSTARLLSKMGDAGSAQALLDRLEVEQDTEVRSALFVALGMACDFSLMEGAGGSVSSEVKLKTLDWSSRFLAQSDPNQIREGADVIGKLLAKNGLTVEVAGYLEMLKNRYEAPDMLASDTGRADLMGAMAGLCLPRSACRTQAIRLFSPLFEVARSEANDRIRQNAVEGLFNIDKNEALRKLRKDYHNDVSAAIRYQLMEAAAEVGEAADLEWLAQRLPQSQDRLMAWQAMSNIVGHKDLDAAALEAWLKGSLGEGSPFTIDQAISLLQAVERKAAGEKNVAIRAWALRAIADYYREKDDPESAARTIVRLKEVQSPTLQADLRGELVFLYLKAGQVELAAKEVQDCLVTADVKDNDPVITAIDAYRGDGRLAERYARVVSLMEMLKPPTRGRPNWERHKTGWLVQPEPSADMSAPPPNSPTN